MFNLTGLKRSMSRSLSMGFGGVLKVGWKQIVSAGLLLYSKNYLCHLTNCLSNDEATPKGGLKDGAENHQTDSGLGEFQWIIQPSGIDAFARKVSFSG